MRNFYPEIDPYNVFELKVSELHTLYVEECGSPTGKPVIFLHGGPGGGCSSEHRRFFDPQKWRIILFDQRGAGRSTPLGELRENTTWDLVADIEAIRGHCQVDQWTVFGGSWGSTLALAYAQRYPQKVNALILRGIFLMRACELTWFYGQGGASKLFPDLWQQYREPVKHVAPEQSIAAYYRLLTGDNRDVRAQAAKAWTDWESSLANLRLQTPGGEAMEKIDAFARIECHYMMSQGWFKPETQLLDDMPKIAHIPGVIVHGRYDVICPIENAFELHNRWPKAKLEVVDAAGHSAFEPGIRSKLIEWTDCVADNLAKC